MYDAFFTFSKRAEQVNQARFAASLSYAPTSNLQIRQIAGAASGIEGVYQSNYTDAASNSANITLEANVNSGTFNMTAYANHSVGLLRNTNPGPPVPSVFYDSNSSEYANHTQEFQGTCKPATFGDYIGHHSMNIVRGAPSGFDNTFVIAGYDSNYNVNGLNVIQVQETSLTTIQLQILSSTGSGFPTNSINTTGQLRLFTHPDWYDTSGPPNSNVLLVGWDNSSNIFLEKYMWDGMNINSIGSANLGGTTNNMFYTGQHDMYYTNSGNILLQTWNAGHTAGILYEINGVTLGVVTSETTTCVAYDPAYDVILIRKANGVQAYSGSLTSPSSSSLNVFQNGSIAYDAVNHPDEPGVIYFGEQASTTLYGHAVYYSGSGTITARTVRSQNLSNTYPPFRQIERTSPSVLMNSVGPNYSTVNPVRTVCDTGTYRATSVAIDYTDATFNTYYEDITQMKHPKSQDYTINADTSTDSTIKGNDHLIASTYNGFIGCFGQNYCNKHWEQTNTSGGTARHHIYILYLGYNLDYSNTDSYSYIATTGINNNFSLGSVVGNPPDGSLHWVKFRNN